jgi:hypothetical protein
VALPQQAALGDARAAGAAVAPRRPRLTRRRAAALVRGIASHRIVLGCVCV